jgi:hypothetical protein
MMEHNTRHYVNLTNGIEWLEGGEILTKGSEGYEREKGKDILWMMNYCGRIRFLRLQSTLCEQNELNVFLRTIDSDLLINLALGHKCIVYDAHCRGHRNMSRAQWQGLAYLKYVLTRLWLLESIEYEDESTFMMLYYVLCRDFEYSRIQLQNFEEHFNVLDNYWPKLKKHLMYFKRFHKGSPINIECKSFRSCKDGDWDYYVNTLRGD